MHFRRNLSWIITVLLFSSASSTLRQPQTLTAAFSSTNFGVAFHPSNLDVGRAKGYSREEVISLVSKVVTKFRNLKMRGLSLEAHAVGDYSLDYIPSAVAKYNENFVNKSSSKPVELLMEFAPPFVQQTLNPERNALFNLLIKRINRTNLIYPGTVKTLLASFPTTNFSNNVDTTFATIIKNVVFASNALNMHQVKNINLGVLLNIGNNCNVSPKLLPYSGERLLQQVSSIMFLVMPTTQDISNGANITFQKFRQLLTCTIDKVRSVNRHLQIGFETGWADTKSIDELVYFWKLVKDFAVKTNTTAIVHQAFDIPFASDPLQKNSGWWKLQESESYRSAEDYIFIEKASPLKGSSSETEANPNFNASFINSGSGNTKKTVKISNAPKSSPTGPPPKDGGSGTLLLIIAVACLTIVFATLGFLLWRRKEVSVEVCGYQVDVICLI